MHGGQKMQKNSYQKMQNVKNADVHILKKKKILWMYGLDSGSDKSIKVY